MGGDDYGERRRNENDGTSETKKPLGFVSGSLDDEKKRRVFRKGIENESKGAGRFPSPEGGGASSSDGGARPRTLKNDPRPPHLSSFAPEREEADRRIANLRWRRRRNVDRFRSEGERKKRATY